METQLEQRYLEAVHEYGLYPSQGNLRYYARRLFDGVQLHGSRFLDIGGGSGLFTFYAAAAGAAQAICLEPELAGSRNNVASKFQQIKETLNLPTADLVCLSLDRFTAAPKTFDVVLLHASINHIDEWATIHLTCDPKATAAYERIAGKLHDLMAPHGRLIITDCSPNNFFPMLRLQNPFCPTIEWHKHQPPEVWAALFARSGFGKRRIQWPTFNMFRTPGRLLLANKAVAFFTMSTFRLELERL